MFDINLLLIIPIILSMSACSVGYLSYFGLYKSPTIVHHINYLFLFSSIIFAFFIGYFKYEEVLYFYYPLIFGMTLLPIVGKNSRLHKYIGILSFFLSLIQFFVFKYHGNTLD